MKCFFAPLVMIRMLARSIPSWIRVPRNSDRISTVAEEGLAIVTIDWGRLTT